MSDVIAWLGAGFVLAGTVLTTLGTVGLFRFPDVLTRLHALTKADNVGLGFCVIGLSLVGRELADTILMALIWIGVMFAGATAAHLVARRELERRESMSPRTTPSARWSQPDDDHHDS